MRTKRPRPQENSDGTRMKRSSWNFRAHSYSENLKIRHSENLKIRFYSFIYLFFLKLSGAAKILFASKSRHAPETPRHERASPRKRGLRSHSQEHPEADAQGVRKRGCIPLFHDDADDIFPANHKDDGVSVRVQRIEKPDRTE